MSQTKTEGTQVADAGAKPPEGDVEAQKPAVPASDAKKEGAAPETDAEIDAGGDEADDADPKDDESEGDDAADAEGADAKKKDDASDFELKTPEGVEVDAELLGSLKSVAKEHGIKPEAAQKLVDAYAARVQALGQQHEAALQKQREDWLSAVKSDKDIGGAKFEQSKTFAQKALKEFAGEEFLDFANRTGIGNHPALFKAFVRIGKALSEDTVSIEARANRPAAENPIHGLYHTMHPKES